MRTKRIAHRIYELWIDGKRFEIDGQNHEYDSKEWQLFEDKGDKMEWWETYPSKRDALEDVQRITSQ